MGRTLPSTTQGIFDQIPELRDFYLTLRRSDMLVLDQFFEAIAQHQAAINNATEMLPIEVIPFAILLEMHKRTDEIRSELLRRLEQIRARLNHCRPN